MPKRRKPVSEMTFPAQVAEIVERGVDKVRRSMGGGLHKRRGPTIESMIDKGQLRRRRDAQSTDSNN